MKISQSIFFEVQEIQQRRASLCLVLLLMLTVFSCAKVGPPLPPLPSDVVLVEDLQLAQSGQDLYLTFPHPVRELSEIEVYRLCEGKAEDIDDTDPVKVVPGTEIEILGFLDRSFVLAPPGDLSPECIFAVRTINLRGKRSGFSNLVSWNSAALPLTPAGLKTAISETLVHVEWQMPGDFKPEQGKAQPEFLINLKEVTKDNSYIISDFTFGEPLSFEVRTIDSNDGVIRLSEPLVLEKFIPEDVFPPRTPSGLIVVRMADRIQLTWDDNTETDLAGYYVHRAAAGGLSQRISTLVTINRFVDEDPPDAPGFTYTVTAVDKWDNESGAAGVVK